MNPQLSSKCASTLLKQYSREFIMKIHPDRHQSSVEARVANSKAVSLITQLFQSDPPEAPPQMHPLCFYLKQTELNPDKAPLKRCKNLKFKFANEYLIFNYALLYQIPHSSASLQSVINLFSAAGVQVDPEVEKGADAVVDSAQSNASTLLQSSIAGINYDFHLSVQALSELRLFLHKHPNVLIDDSNSEALALLALLQPSIQSLTNSSNITPLFIFNTGYQQPVFDEKQAIYRLPCNLNIFPSNK